MIIGIGAVFNLFPTLILISYKSQNVGESRCIIHKVCSSSILKRISLSIIAISILLTFDWFNMPTDLVILDGTGTLTNYKLGMITFIILLAGITLISTTSFSLKSEYY